MPTKIDIVYMKRALSYLTVVSLLVFTLTGCTKEDLSMCVDPEPQSVGVRFVYTHNADRTDRFSSDVTAISLFVFDQREVCVARFREQGDTLQHNYVMSLNSLPSGSYTLVAWADVAENTSYELNEEHIDGTLSPFEMEKTLFERARTVLASQKTPHVDQVPTDLYHGIVSQVTVKKDQGQLIEIPLIKNTNLIRTVIKGLDKVSNSNSPEYIKERYRTTIKAANGRMGFDNKLIPGSDQLIYQPYSVQTKSLDVHNENRVLRMQKEVPVMLTITDTQTGEELATFDVVKWLFAIPGNGVKTNEDLDRYDTYDITVDVSDFQTQLTVTINGWTVVIRTGGMGAPER